MVLWTLTKPGYNTKVVLVIYMENSGWVRVMVPTLYILANGLRIIAVYKGLQDNEKIDTILDLLFTC